MVFSMAGRGIWNLFEELPQILKHGVFFVRARAIGDKELLVQAAVTGCYRFVLAGIRE
jgi:hypothetical protein